VLQLARQISNAGGVALRAMIRDPHGNPIAPPLPHLLKRAHPTGKRRKAIDQVGARKGWWADGKTKRRRVRLYYRRQQGLDRDLINLVGITACRDHLTGEIRDPHWRQTGERYLSARRLAEITDQPISRRVRRRAGDGYVAYEAGDKTERAMGNLRAGGVIPFTEEFRAERTDGKGKKIGGYETVSAAKRIVPIEFFDQMGGLVAHEARKAYREAKDAADLDQKIWRKREAARKKAAEEARAEGEARFKTRVEAQRAPAPEREPLPDPPPSMRPPGPSPELVEAIMQEPGFSPGDWARAVDEARRRERAQDRAPDTS